MKSPLFTVVCLLLVALACISGFDETGKLCSAFRPCSSGYSCVSGACAVSTGGGNKDAGPDGGPIIGPLVNLMVNGDFESTQGVVITWAASSGAVVSDEMTRIHWGLKSAKLQAFGQPAGITPVAYPVAATSAGQIYCASAWVSGDGTAMHVVLAPDAGTLTAGTLVTAGAGWTQAKAVWQSPGVSELTLSISAPTTGPSTVVYVDDVQLWQSAALDCPEGN